MNPLKETGRDYVYGNFGINGSSKSDGWHGDLEAILAEFETSAEGSGQSKTSCEKSR